MSIFIKYYVCEFVTLDGEPLKVASCTYAMSRFYNPCNVTVAIRNHLEKEGLSNHRIINLRRIR